MTEVENLIRDSVAAELVRLRAEVARLRAALQQIVSEADSDDGLTAWDGSDIARRALQEDGDASGSAS